MSAAQEAGVRRAWAVIEQFEGKTPTETTELQNSVDRMPGSAPPTEPQSLNHQRPRHRKSTMSISCAPSCDPEAEFVSQTDRASRKLLGQFFTPRPMAELMASWIGGCSPKSVLDPAVGPGVLLDACVSAGVGCEWHGIDIDPLALDLAAARLPQTSHLIHADFLGADLSGQFDAIIANPPYVRHHNLEVDDGVLQKIVLASGHRFGKLTNLYVYFVLQGLALLREGGRAAFLIPAEWSNANYGQGLKDYFAETGFLRHVIYFSHEGLPFDDNLSTACVLFLEKGSSNGELFTHYVNGKADLISLERLTASTHVWSQTFKIRELARLKKWDAVISNRLTESKRGAVRLSELGRTRRGIATGDNSYFMLSDDESKDLGLPPSALQPCIGKAIDARGYVFNAEDFDALMANGRKAYLFNPPDPLQPQVARYLAEGIRRGVTNRYLTRTKPIWYRAEERQPAPIWITVFGRNRLRFIRNKTACKNLTTFHCFYPNGADPVMHDALVACLNSEVVAEAVARQQRVYGGGLLKLEPKDILDIEVPDLRQLERGLIEQLARELAELDRTGSSSSNLNALVEKAFSEAAAKGIGRLL